MANFPIFITETLWSSVYTLEYGSFTYGGVMLFTTLWYIFWPDLNWADWIFLLLGATPMAASFITMLAKKDWSISDPTLQSDPYKAAIKANWYYSFFVWCIGTFNIIAQTVILGILISKVGGGSIRFRGGFEGLDGVGASDEFVQSALE